MFVGDEVAIDVSFAVARARLANLIRGGLVHRASAQAYSGETAGLARVGPRGSVPGLSRVVRVRIQDLKDIGDSARFALRWEVAGPGGTLFPALDADITVTPAGEHSSTLVLAGAYRPPLGTAGAALDRAVMRRVATATIRAFLAHIAEAIAHPAAAAEPEAKALHRWAPALPAEPDAP